MQLTLDRAIVEKLRDHAASAAHLIGHLDDDAHRELIGQIGDRVDMVVHGLTELLGTPSALAAPDAAAPDDRGVRDGAPMLISAPSDRGRQKARGAPTRASTAAPTRSCCSCSSTTGRYCTGATKT